MDLGSSDVILGMKWLAILGETQVDWGSLIMRFKVGDTTITLHGDASLSKTLVTMKSMMKAFRKGGEGVLLELGCLTTEEVEVKIPNSLQGVLSNFNVVFEEPCGLPHQRRWDHTITLQAGVSPVSVRPFRYPHLLKIEIEKLVREMLVSSIIRPSINPFFSPVLLVKKKDEG